jgi:lambda repressor-like predicted transcriptional regulator
LTYLWLNDSIMLRRTLKMKEGEQMVKINKLRAQMALHGYTIARLAKEMSVSSRTLSDRLNKSPEKFTQREMENLIKILKIEEPDQIFFS